MAKISLESILADVFIMNKLMYNALHFYRVSQTQNQIISSVSSFLRLVDEGSMKYTKEIGRVCTQQRASVCRINMNVDPATLRWNIIEIPFFFDVFGSVKWKSILID